MAAHIKPIDVQSTRISRIFRILDVYFGDLGWWPAKTSFEVVIGAVLTQNTSWNNVEKAIVALRKACLMTPQKIVQVPLSRLADIIRPTGYFRVKAERLKAISRFLIVECGGRFSRLEKTGTDELRNKLLAVKGIGPETADSILVYAMGRPVFVVDAYARRIFTRHGIIVQDIPYNELQTSVHRCFGEDMYVLNQFHALLVETGKRFCRKKQGKCGECPLRIIDRRVEC